VRQSAIDAARLRFRPIIMTSFAFILGMVPMVLATGAGSAARQSLGTAVFGGMITSSVLAVFFVPVFFVAFQWLIELRNGPPKPLPGHAAPPSLLETVAHDADGRHAPHANGEPAKPAGTTVGDDRPGCVG
jgi:HAE1 family hydrophobic/amphiphilic exporter-1